MGKKGSTTASTQRPRDRRYTASPSRRSSGLTRLALFAGISLAVLTAAAYFLWPAAMPEGPATPGAVTVIVGMDGFMPHQIEGRAGEPITLRLVNNDTKFHTDGGGWHQLAFETLRVDVNIPPETTQEFTFTPANAGTYRFYCSVCCGGKENPSMWGTLEVKA
ncbi:MAG: cupredoxin domain-containing protein [Dehalococcoidia bacterium]|nr:cupredoxin domain-containing protein [Dehalococcoidia bacterium]